MAEEIEILQGNDVPERTFKIKVAGAIQLIADYADYHIYIYQEKNGKHSEVAVFKKTPDVGEYQIRVVDVNTIGFVVGRAITKTVTGDLYAEIRTQRTAGSHFQSSLINAGAKAFHVATIKESTRPKLLQ